MNHNIKFSSVIVLTLIALFLALPAQAQESAGSTSDIILLNDGTPGIDVVVTMPPGSTGVIGLEVENAVVTLKDSAGNVVFQATSELLKGMEIRFAPDAAPHTLTVERLPGTVQGYVRVKSQTEFTPTGAVTTLDASELTTEQATRLPLSSQSAAGTVNLNLPDTATVEAVFPGAPVTVQLVNMNTGMSVATLSDGQIDGVQLILEAGQYQMTLLNTDLNVETLASVGVTPPVESDFESQVAMMEGVVQDTAAVTAGSGNCVYTLNPASVNLRSGPGTGYSVIDYGYQGDAFLVGGTNPQENWFVIATDTGSAWVSSGLGTFSGDCAGLTVYNIPYRAAPEPEVVVQAAPPVIVQQPASGQSFSGSSGYHDDDEHEEHDDDDDD